jgi:hypothetical protein
MKKLLMLAVVLGLGLVAVGCGPTPSTKATDKKTDSTEVKKTETTEKK